MCKDWMTDDNRVTLCYEHHAMVHQHGSQNFAETLREYRDQRLLEYNGNK